MGTDCRLICQMKDDTYRHLSLDRLYVFNQSLEEHQDIYHAGGLVKDSRGVYGTNHWFTLEHLTAWCYKRRELILRLEKDNPAVLYDMDVDYNIRWLNVALDFVATLLPERANIERVALLDDMDDFYFDLINQGKTVIDL